jgi:hypothetical protein
MGNAMVDMRLPNIDAEDPNMKMLKARFFLPPRAARSLVIEIASATVFASNAVNL